MTDSFYKTMYKKRKEFLKTLSKEELERRLQKRREYNRNYYLNKIKKLSTKKLHK